MSYFRFKQFTICQEKAAMKVGTDGVLLGAWADLSRASAILDIGTGTGLIALMAAQRSCSANISAVEIDEETCKQAGENIANSPWKERIALYHTSVLLFDPGRCFDLIICNPPFFIRSTPAPDKARTLARHCCRFSHRDLLHTADRLLDKEHGLLAVILPVKEGEELLKQSGSYHLFPKRVTEVYPTVEHPAPKRLLIELSRTASTLQHSKLTLEISRHIYCPEYRELTKDFYLFF